MTFHYLVRGIVFANGRVLLAHQKGAGNTFLPGGHIAPGESAGSALIREIKEEIGKTAMVKQFVGAVEAAWAENGEDQHEINLLFEISIQDLNPSVPPASRESHLEFLWASPDELEEEHNLLPAPLIDCLTNWKSDGCFWGSALRSTK